MFYRTNFFREILHKSIGLYTKRQKPIQAHHTENRHTKRGNKFTMKYSIPNDATEFHNTLRTFVCSTCCSVSLSCVWSESDEMIYSGSINSKDPVVYIHTHIIPAFERQCLHTFGKFNTFACSY